MQPSIRNDGVFGCEKRPETVQDGCQNLGLLVMEHHNWAKGQPNSKARPSIPVLADSLLDSKLWSRGIFGGCQFQGVIREVEGRGMLLGLTRSRRCLALLGTKLLSVGELSQ